MRPGREPGRADETGAAAPGGRLVFANQLRGLAALMVLAVHFTVVVQLMRPVVGFVVAAPPLDTPVSGLALAIRALPVDPAATGVGLFFLISGFVIPFALERGAPVRFLLARALRILPTFWVALALEALAIAASGEWWHRPFPFDRRQYVADGLLLTSALDLGNVDLVSWTLMIEAKFYLLAALCRGWLLRRPAALGLAVAAAALAANVAARAGLLPLPPRLVAEATYLDFILIGTLFSARLGGRIGTATLLAAAGAMTAAMFLCWWAGPLAGEYPGRTRSLSAALALFAACYAARARFRPFRPLDALARISYPLYLLHPVLGFAAISFLVGAARLPYPAAAALALGLVVGVSALLHRAVEAPSLRLGRRLARGPAGRSSRSPDRAGARA